MQGKTPNEVYKSFLDFIAVDIQQERRVVNRRILSVFFWCFLLPALISITVLLLVKMRVFPRNVKSHLDWLVLVLPVLYSLYILSSEVLAQVPTAFKKGGIATTLEQAAKEGEWRERVSESMGRLVVASEAEWEWIILSFKMDLAAMEHRTRYLTALAGAVFFLLMQGIDTFTGSDEKMPLVKPSLLGWIESSSNDFSQVVGLALFLVLLYLSGSQIYQSLWRYLNCAELVARGSSHSDS